MVRLVTFNVGRPCAAKEIRGKPPLVIALSYQAQHAEASIYSIAQFKPISIWRSKTERMALAEKIDVRTALWGVLTLGVCLVFYAQYFFSGLNFISDDGNYAQIAYELYLGRSISDLDIHYGILWFKFGELLFHLFEVNFFWVRFVFISSITLTVLLIFYTTFQIIGNRPVSALLALIPIPATAAAIPAIYGICIMLNVAVQMHVARKVPSMNLRDAAIAGAVLAITFQIRPDFGYVFSLPLAIILFLNHLSKKKDAVSRSPTSASLRIAGAAVAGFVAANIPIAIDAFANGYAGLLIMQYLEYPAIMLEYFSNGLSLLLGGGSQASAPGAGTLLQRPSFSDIFFGNTRTRHMAILVYGPIIAVAAYLILNIRRLKHSLGQRQWKVLAEFVVILSAAAAFPHYFFFRPDLPHIANFMLGYMVVVAALGAQLYTFARAADLQRWRRAIACVACALLVLQLVHTVWIGFMFSGNGAIAIAKDRPEIFTANDVVKVNVTTGAKDTLEFLNQVIRENSNPGDKIVCVPYCPGIAFMTQRQMMFNDFYVDDSFLVREPDWLPGAIQKTRDQRPPVVIVFNTALNGTKISRFKNWAAPYVSMLEEQASETVERGEITVYLM